MRRLSDEEKWRRGTLQPCRVRVEVPSRGGVDEDDWLRGLSGEARLQGVWCLQYYRFAPEDRQRFRHYLRAYAVRERVKNRHMAETRRVEAWLWEVSQRVTWRRR